MPLRWSPSSRFRSGPLLVLAASCLWGCPQLLSDDFNVVVGAPGPGGDDPLGEDGHGTGGSAGSSPLPNPSSSAGAGGTGTSPVSVSGAPAVVSVSPGNDESGVAADAVVTLTFSEPMNTPAVEAAYSSSDLPAGSVHFSWSNNDTVLQITPDQPLALASGTSPETTVALRYAFELGPGAVDRQGEGLPRFSTSFTTLRELTQTLDAIQDRSLTGNYRSDDVYGNNSCVLDSPTTCVGDSSNGDSTYRGFVSFDLSTLPASVRELSAAQLSMTIDTVRNSPFAVLGSLVADHVSFDGIDLDSFAAAALGSPIPVASAGSTGTQLSASVLSAVQDDLPARGRSQFRLRFTTDTNSDGTGDLIEVLWTTERLRLTYLVP